MKKLVCLLSLTAIFISCYQAPLQWTGNKDERLMNSRWYNNDSINFDAWQFDTFSCYNGRLKNEIFASYQAFSVDMQWEAFKQCSLVVHATYYLRSNPSLPNYYHKSFNYSLSVSSGDSVLTVNGENYFFAGVLHD